MKELLGLFDTKTTHIKVFKTDYDFTTGHTLYILEERNDELGIVKVKYGTKEQMLEIVKWYMPLEINNYNALLIKLA